MKKLFSILLALLFVFTLIPTRMTHAEINPAEIKKGEKCPYCHQGKWDWFYCNAQEHAMGCWNVDCYYYGGSYRWVYGDHTVNGSKCIAGTCDICGEQVNLSHSGGTATCVSGPICEKCGQEYGEQLGHDWQTEWTIDGDIHYHACSRCTERKDEAAHNFVWSNVDDNTHKGVCECGAEITEAHDWSSWKRDDNGSDHYRVCQRAGCTAKETEAHHEDRFTSASDTEHHVICLVCSTGGTVFKREPHSGGTATCTEKAVCEKCGEEYGSPDPDAHNWDTEWSDDGTNHYHKCLNDGCTARNDEAAHSGGTATTESGPICEICGHEYGSPVSNAQDIDLQIEVPDKAYGEDVECIVYASVDGEYMLSIDGVLQTTITVRDSLACYNAGKLYSGTYTATVSFSGNDDYNPASAEDTFEVVPAGTPFSITASTSESFYGETVTITPTLPYDAAGVIEYFLQDGTFLGMQDVSESLTLPMLDAGTWVVIAKYSGDINYECATDTVLITIRPANLTITGVTASDKIYDGTNTATIDTSSATMSGFVPGNGSDPDYYFSKITFTGTFEDANVGSGKQVTVTATLPGRSRNYVIDSINTPTASITKRALTITANDQEYIYNGQTQGEGDTVYEDPSQIAEKVTVVGLQGDDCLTSIVLDGQGKEVGEHEIMPSNATVGEATGNYDIIYVPGKLKIKANSYTVTLSASPAAGGTVSGGGTYADGASVTVTATPADGYSFVNWTENGSPVSTDASYTFTVTGARELMANFALVPPVLQSASIHAPERMTTGQSYPIVFTLTFDRNIEDDQSRSYIRMHCICSTPSGMKPDGSTYQQQYSGNTFTFGFTAEVNSNVTDTAASITIEWEGNIVKEKRVILVAENECVVSFDGNGGSGTMDLQVVQNGVDTQLNANAFTRGGYVFAGWNTAANGTGDAYADGAAINISSDTTLYAQWKALYTVKFVNEDGTELQSTEVAYGETPAYTGDTPTKAATAQYTYTFAGWTPEIVPVTGAAIYTATYSSTVNEYTVKFVNENGTELQSGKVPYGDTPAYTGATPTKAATEEGHYIFDGWTPALTAVTEDATYTAKYQMVIHSGGTATCTEKAVCAVCGQEYGETLEHDWQPAYDSMRHYNKCSRCDTIQEGTEHDHDWHQEVEWNADRSKAYSIIWCDCGYREEDSSDYSGVSNRVEPTCTEEGSVTHWATFARIFHSRATITDPIPALGHSYAEIHRTITRVWYRCGECGDRTWVYNARSKNAQPGLVRNGNGENVDYKATVEKQSGRRVLTVKPVSENSEELWLYLSPADVRTWLADGIDTVAYRRGDALLEIDLGAVTPDWFADAPETIDFFLLSVTPEDDGVRIDAEALIGEQKLPAKTLTGLRLHSGNAAEEIKENGVYAKPKQ